MDIYHVWCNLKPGVGDVAFCDCVASYLGLLRDEQLIVGYRVTRRKLGFGPPQLGEFHIAIEVANLAQLDAAFSRVARRAGPIEGLHQAVNSLATDLTFALYRDFPDSIREHGEEQF
ncbi:MAG TPA: DUF6614 family protein [Candidatus Baltobacteraceae bacterium]|jgi:hypothetical protein|nr:DUF6614 family protein [Candidatus Baltobacteraceae bacterium]